MSFASFVFPAVKGIQAKREYFASMVPLEVIPKIFQFVDEQLPPEIRAQRILNRARIPEIRDYILENPDDYVFSSITVSVDGGMEFIPLNEDEPLLGHITISMSAKFLINDGQHRQAAIAEAIKKNPELKNEHISVVFYRDEGLAHSQQMFSDLNRYAIRPTKSINILFNSREESSIVAKRVINTVNVFQDMTEKEHTSISNRSKALFTLSAICSGTEALLKDMDLGLEEKCNLAIHFWEQVSQYIPFWKAVKNGQVKSSDVRKNTICIYDGRSTPYTSAVISLFMWLSFCVGPCACSTAGSGSSRNVSWVASTVCVGLDAGASCPLCFAVTQWPAGRNWR